MRAFWGTDIGRMRSMNQDFVLACTEPIGNLPNLFIVADGMGGHNAGDFASRYGASVLAESVRQNQNFKPVKILRQGIEEANARILEQARRDSTMEGMGTTMVAVTIVGEYAYVANVGDSRLYLVSDRIDQVTQDHSLVAEMVRMGELTPEEARNHPDKNIITRAVGTSDSVKVDFFDIHLEEGDRLLLCTDGLSNMVADEEIYSLLNDCNEETDKARVLIDRANRNGGRDNIGVIIIEPFDDEEKKEC